MFADTDSNLLKLFELLLKVTLALKLKSFFTSSYKLNYLEFRKIIYIIEIGKILHLLFCLLEYFHVCGPLCMPICICVLREAQPYVSSLLQLLFHLIHLVRVLICTQCLPLRPVCLTRSFCFVSFCFVCLFFIFGDFTLSALI